MIQTARVFAKQGLRFLDSANFQGKTSQTCEVKLFKKSDVVRIFLTCRVGFEVEILFKRSWHVKVMDLCAQSDLNV